MQVSVVSVRSFSVGICVARPYGIVLSCSSRVHMHMHSHTRSRTQTHNTLNVSHSAAGSKTRTQRFLTFPPPYTPSTLHPNP